VSRRLLCLVFPDSKSLGANKSLLVLNEEMWPRTLNWTFHMIEADACRMDEVNRNCRKLTIEDFFINLLSWQVDLDFRERS
jgi:hypothetical protein